MLYSASRRFSSASSRCRSCSRLGAGTALEQNQKPDEWQPRLARERNRTIVDEHLGRVRHLYDLEQIAELQRIARPEPRAVAPGVARSGLAVLGRSLGDVQGLGELRHVQ